MMSSTRSGCIITLPEPRSKEASIDNLVKSEHAVSEIRERERTDRQTDRRTCSSQYTTEKYFVNLASQTSFGRREKGH